MGSVYERVFKRKYAERSEDEANVLKTQAVALPDGRALFFITITKAGKWHVREGFVKTLMRMGSMKKWIELSDAISSSDSPGEPLRLKDMGYDGMDREIRLYWNKKHATRANYKKFFRNRFSKAMHLSDFLEKMALHKKLGINFIYPLEYEGLSIPNDLDKFENDRWYEHDVRTCREDTVWAKPKVIM